MKKKIIALCLVVCLLAIAVVGGTMAYLTDDDAATNVMTVGRVSIDQIEEERDLENGGLKAFTQDKFVYPAVYEGPSIPYADPANWIVADDPAWKIVENDNVVDKFVTVKNTGNSNAWVRTIVAFEVGPNAINDPYMHLVCNGNSAETAWTYEWLQENGQQMLVQLGDTYYAICVFTYNAELTPEEITDPSIKQVYLGKEVTNEIVASYGNTFEILVLSQAVQAAGFNSAAEGLNAAFGAVTHAKVVEWMADLDKAEVTAP